MNKITLLTIKFLAFCTLIIFSGEIKAQAVRVGSISGGCDCNSAQVCTEGATSTNVSVPIGSKATISFSQNTFECMSTDFLLETGENVIMTWTSNGQSRSDTLFKGNGVDTAQYGPMCFFNNYSMSITLTITLVSNRQDEQIQLLAPVSAGNSGCTNLPVELVYFSGKLRSSQVSLTWQTSTELNNAKFIIETSHQGETFQRIGEIAGAGTTTEPQDYTFTHHTPSAGINYYRLKQVDFDGTFEYSKVIAIDAPGSKDIFAFPNPARDKITLQYDQSKGAGNIQLLDALGRRINANIAGYAGNYEVTLPESLARGTYWLKVERGGKVQTLPVVKE